MQTRIRSKNREKSACRGLSTWLWFFTVLMLASWIGGAGVVAASEPDLRTAPAVLLLIEDHGCPYCARWDREVGVGYPKSEEGRFAPLVRRFRGAEDIRFVDNVIYSPTFILLSHGREVGRIIGYQGPDFFWADISRLVAKAGFKGGGSKG